MTKLDCTVTTCVHNAEKCCCKNTIHRRETAVIPAAGVLRKIAEVFLRTSLRHRNRNCRSTAM